MPIGVEQIEAEEVAVEMNCPVEIGDFQVNVADVRSGGDGRLGRDGRRRFLRT